MPRFVRVENTMVHIPSLSSVSMLSNCFGRPYLMLHYHTKMNMKIQYSSWEKCEADFNRIKTALVEIETLLQRVPLTDSQAIQVARAAAESTSASQVEVVEKIANLKVSLSELDGDLQRHISEMNTESAVFAAPAKESYEQAAKNIQVATKTLNGVIDEKV
jgi:hypothetical protein